MDTTLSDPLVDRRLDGRYRIEARLARGGMASVYLATDMRLDRKVAVKVMHPALAEDDEFVARFTREARAAAGLSHPDVVAVYDQGSDGGHVFLVMEYVAGITLRELLRRRGRLDPGEAVAVMDHVLAALAAAHRAGLVHRDVKPENVLVTPDGRVKVADFGLARTVAGATVTADSTTLLGTAAYLSPEQVREGRSDARSDVYSAGVLMYELLTGAAPFSADTPVALAYRHVNEDVPAPSARVPGIPGELDALVLAATARDPDERPADARTLHASLLAVRDRLGLHAAVPSLPDQETQPLARPAADTLVVERHREPTPVAQAPSRRRRRGLIALILVVVAAIVAGIGGWYLAVDRYTHAPGVISLTRTAAEARLHKAGLHAKWLPDVFSDTVASGRVAYESPGPNEKVRSGGTVALALSKGADAVPDVTNLTPDQATAQLRDNQLSVSGQTRIYSDTVRSGHVVRTDPPVGTHVAPGSSVRLFVSKGAAPVKLPDVTGKSEDDARSTLTSLGLTVTVTRKYDDKVRSGFVISTTPPAGTSLHKGDPVTVVVSRGPKTYPVPDVINMKIRDAIRVIREAGFNPDPVQSFPGGPGRVFRESPPGGSQQPKGTTIELDYY